MQSATTGLPEHMCRFNMEKNHFVLSQMDKILDSLTRGLDLDILSKGYGMEARGVPVSYQAQSPVLGMVLPSNSPGVHTLWMPIIPMQIGLVLKPGRLHADELVGRLGAVAQGQLGLGVQFAGLLDHLEQFADGHLAENVAGAPGVAHVALDEAAVGAADLGQRLTGGEMDDFIDIEALVGLALAEDGDVGHGGPSAN
jgi:hypothetical protein